MRLVDVDVALVKNTDGSTWHRAWVTHADGTSASVKIFVPHDLDHFVIESSLGITHGFWGIFAAGGWRRQSELASARDPRRASASSGGPDDPLVREHAPDVNFAEAVVYAIGNMFGDGPDTLEGVRDRLRRMDDPRLHALADQLDEERLQVIYEARAQAVRRWQHLEPGGTLRLTWAPSTSTPRS
jgi:hypothetical protein